MAITTVALEELRQRYERDDPSLTPEEMDILRRSLPSGQWFDLYNAKERRGGVVVSVKEGRSEAQIAQEYADRMLKLLNEVTVVLNEAKQKHGMQISFSYAPANAFGFQTLASLEITKKLC